MQKVIHFLYVPFTGLGKYNGFRGNRWLKNRIQIFKQFVVPSLQAQTCQEFTLWISWRPEEKDNKQVKELQEWLTQTGLKVVHTFHGVCFWDDKYENEVARLRLVNNLHYTMGDLHDVVGESEEVLMTIQPSDDLYDKHAVETLQFMFANEDWQAIGFKKGYIINYWTKEVAEYNPTTNPPFYTIRFPKKTFLDPLKHLDYTALKQDVGKYKKGTPLPSHEYVGDCLKYAQIDERGFMVGTHLENISTTWQIPFKGDKVNNLVAFDFGVSNFEKTELSRMIRIPICKRFYFNLPYKAQRKIRYWLTEKFVWKNPLKRLSVWRNYTTNQHRRWWEKRKVDWQKDYLSTWNHPHRQVLAGLLARLKWFSLFEVGCGPGANLVQLLKSPILKGRQMQLGGCDVNKDAIGVAASSFMGPNKQPAGTFFVCPSEDILMSDKSADVILTDMTLIYVGKDKIDKSLQEMKRVARSYVVLCEFDSTHWDERWWVKLFTGYNVYDYKKKLLDNGFYDIVKYKLRKEDWLDNSLHTKYTTIIIAKPPKYV